MEWLLYVYEISLGDGWMQQMIRLYSTVIGAFRFEILPCVRNLFDLFTFLTNEVTICIIFQEKGAVASTELPSGKLTGGGKTRTRNLHVRKPRPCTIGHRQPTECFVDNFSRPLVLVLISAVDAVKWEPKLSHFGARL